MAITVELDLKAVILLVVQQILKAIEGGKSVLFTCFGPQIRGHVSPLDLITSVFNQFSSCKVKHTISDVKKYHKRDCLQKNPPFKSYYRKVMICGTDQLEWSIRSRTKFYIRTYMYHLDDLVLLRVINRTKLKRLPLANECLTWGEQDMFWWWGCWFHRIVGGEWWLITRGQAALPRFAPPPSWHCQLSQRPRTSTSPSTSPLLRYDRCNFSAKRGYSKR